MCGCGATVNAAPQVQVAVTTDQSTNATTLGANVSVQQCDFTPATLQGWKATLETLPSEKRVNHNIYMGYVLSGLADNRLICGSLFPMLKLISEHILRVTT